MARRPRSKPDLVDRPCAAIEHLAARRASPAHALQWVTLDDPAQYLGMTDDEGVQAVALALERGRIITDGGAPPHTNP